jgi:hypothetical protein
VDFLTLDNSYTFPSLEEDDKLSPLYLLYIARSVHQCISFPISIISEPSASVNHDHIIFRLARPAPGDLETSFCRPYQRRRSTNCSTYGPKSTWKTRIPDLGREAFKDGVEWRQATDTAIATVARVATSYSGPFYFSTDAGTPTLITKGRGITGSKLDWNRSSEGIQPSGRGRQKDSCLGVG